MIRVVIGGQFGSEGKGSVTSWLARRCKLDLVIRIGSPNAGHTFEGPDGTIFKMRQLPCSWAFSNAPICIPASAIVDTEVLLAELEMIRKGGYSGEVCISPLAAVIEDGHRMREDAILTGTVGTGTGAARAAKCLRQAKLISEFPDFVQYAKQDYVEDVLASPDSSILIETTQGFGLSLDGRYYPHCTSTNVDVYRALSDAGVPHGLHDIQALLVLRTFPIRIAGNSGPLFEETSWPRLRHLYGNHIPNEQSTVTQRTRRVGNWDSGAARSAIRYINPAQIFLTFVDYVFPDIVVGGIDVHVDAWLRFIEASLERSIDWVGVGPGRIIDRKALSEQT